MTESTLPPDRDDFCDIPCDPYDSLSVEQQLVLREHARFTEALGMTAATAEFKPAAPVKPQNWAVFLSDELDPYAALRNLLDRQLERDQKAV